MDTVSEGEKKTEDGDWVGWTAYECLIDIVDTYLAWEHCCACSVCPSALCAATLGQSHSKTGPNVLLFLSVVKERNCCPTGLTHRLTQFNPHLQCQKTQ